MDHASHGRLRDSGPADQVRELTGDMGNTMLVRDVQVLEPGEPPVKFLGWMLERTVDGFRLMINPQLIEDIVQDSGLASSTRKCATARVKDRVVDETPLEREEHSNFRTRVGRLLFLWDSSRDMPRHQLSRIALPETPHSFSVDDTRHEAVTLPEGTSGALGHGRR